MLVLSFSHLLAITLTIIVIAQNPGADRCQPGLCGGTAMISAFQQAAQRVLGSEAQLRTQVVTSDPSDEVAVAKAPDADGVVELSFSPEGEKARLHCYLAREKRWIEREISFGDSSGSTQSEINERGRLLGFAVATMYASDASEETHEQESPSPPAVPPSASEAARAAESPRLSRPQSATVPERRKYVAEFAGIASTGLEGTASGLGASAGFRLVLRGPIWARVFIAGRSGNIPEAQASTRTALMGGGFAFAFLPDAATFELGSRLDFFASYFDASHLSEDDVAADRRSRWQAGADVVAEGGWRVTRDAGVFFGIGVEGILGKTEVYTHHQRVAVVPPLRATGELGFRTRF
ncbi:MAG TPA: hypothetical protein VER96_21020 [Polyangiaceae bacterium]|nr:hypothetical protein [Polyangiaceae bacterium]